MNYITTDVDKILDIKMSTPEGKSIIIDLQTKIEEEELQIELFKESLNHLNSEIAKIEPVLKQANATLEKLLKHKPHTQDIKRQIAEVNSIREEYKAKRLAFEENALIWNISGYITLISIDIKKIQKGLYSATSEWDKRFFARQSYLIMYDAPNQIIRQIKKLIERKGYKSFYTDLTKAQKDLEKFVRENWEYINVVRNNTAGHKDEKVIKQLNVIENIEWAVTIETTNQFEKQIIQLGNLLQKMIKAGIDNLGKVFDK
ncbi:hypothetical protein U5907_05545 [Bacteroidales bacterium MB20-C3-3]|nr:hypothetical protein U5907_05545 [Bacteroidales bacterium MB20-C3-3]